MGLQQYQSTAGLCRGCPHPDAPLAYPPPMPGCRLWVSLGLPSPPHEMPQHQPWHLLPLRMWILHPATPSPCSSLQPAGPDFPSHHRQAALGSGNAWALGCWSAQFGPTPLILGKMDGQRPSVCTITFKPTQLPLCWHTGKSRVHSRILCFDPGKGMSVPLSLRHH